MNSAHPQDAATQATALDKDWWRGAVIYQIYPRSYQDTSGDGIGAPIVQLPDSAEYTSMLARTPCSLTPPTTYTKELRMIAPRPARGRTPPAPPPAAARRGFRHRSRR